MRRSREDLLALNPRKVVNQMSPVYPFHSVNEIQKPPQNRVFHNNSACPPGRDIPEWERRQGTNNYRLCEICDAKNNGR
jgi:hypothetical protein